MKMADICSPMQANLLELRRLYPPLLALQALHEAVWTDLIFQFKLIPHRRHQCEFSSSLTFRNTCLPAASHGLCQFMTCSSNGIKWQTLRCHLCSRLQNQLVWNILFYGYIIVLLWASLIMFSHPGTSLYNFN